MEPIKKLFTDLFILSEDRADIPEITQRINSGSTIKGTNMCILILAIFIASIGLNMNSTAVVIGAMLISPLMGVIMGIGYGMASYDTNYVKKSFFKLMFQVSLSVLASAIYFQLSPISTASSELLARTEPTIWDVLIAIFGGLAGIIGITRKEKSNVIPGVAIATALMPPLCTAGYGLSIHSAKFFLGALYLFFINSFFICLASFIFLKMIRIPSKAYISRRIFNRQRTYLVIIGILTIIPSIYMAYKSVKLNLETTEMKTYIADNFIFDNSQVISYKMLPNDKLLEIILIGQPLQEHEIASLTTSLKKYNQLRDFRLKIIQNNYSRAISKDDVQSLIENKLNESNNNNLLSTKEAELKKYKTLSVSYYPAYLRLNDDKKLLTSLNKSASILFPQVENIEGASISSTDDKGNIVFKKFFVIVFVKEAMQPKDAAKLQKWITAEANMPVMMNLQLSNAPQDNIISGNGINW
ncbi:DUF389 domain-containing protein [Pectinatus sottacetonis]|uniref:DUF389 domain-containing protein n=1 Tax=Pectinatus sottacetonis TaxID=1002795 RepID=UPI0018C5D62E|nr:DUF389 domain-containing protein [Pectinatus sottacetonis]